MTLIVAVCVLAAMILVFGTVVAMCVNSELQNEIDALQRDLSSAWDVLDKRSAGKVGILQPRASKPWREVIR